MDFVKFLLSQYFTWYIFFFISRELLISRTPIKNTIFWKSMIKSFRWIEINCFNIFRFLVVSKNLQKMHYFRQFKDHNSGKKLDKWPHFSHLFFEFYLSVIFIFVFENCQSWFSWSPPFVHSGLQNVWILEV